MPIHKIPTGNRRKRTVAVSGDTLEETFRRFFGVSYRDLKKRAAEYAERVAEDMRKNYPNMDENDIAEVKQAATRGYIHAQVMGNFASKLAEDEDALNVFVGRDAIPLMILTMMEKRGNKAFIGVSRKIPGFKELTEANKMALEELGQSESALVTEYSARDVLHFGGLDIMKEMDRLEREIQGQLETLREILPEGELKKTEENMREMAASELAKRKEIIRREYMEKLKETVRVLDEELREKTGRGLLDMLRPHLERIYERAKRDGKKKVRFVDQGYYGTHPMILKAVWEILGFNKDVDAETALLYAYHEPAEMHDLVHARIDESTSGKEILGRIFEHVPYIMDKFEEPNVPRKIIEKNKPFWHAYYRGIIAGYKEFKSRQGARERPRRTL